MGTIRLRNKDNIRVLSSAVLQTSSSLGWGKLRLVAQDNSRRDMLKMLILQNTQETHLGMDDRDVLWLLLGARIWRRRWRWAAKDTSAILNWVEPMPDALYPAVWKLESYESWLIELEILLIKRTGLHVALLSTPQGWWAGLRPHRDGDLVRLVCFKPVWEWWWGRPWRSTHRATPLQTSCINPGRSL
jgi:hypothetical protein